MHKLNGIAMICALVCACNGDNGKADSGADLVASDAIPDLHPVVDSGPDTISPYVPTAATVLSPGNPGKDEDPCVLRADDGSLHAAFFSDRTGDGDIFWTRTPADELRWSSLKQLTNGPKGHANFYPNMYQDKSGTIHMVWYRRQTATPFHAWVMHKSLAKNVWSAETKVTTVPTAADQEDWVPTITGDGKGSLSVFFVSRIRGGAQSPHQLYLTQKSGGAWSDPKALSLNSATEHDHLPFAVHNGGRFVLVWNQHDTTSGADPSKPWTNPTTDVLLSRSDNGSTWDSPTAVTSNDTAGLVDGFPALYPDHGGKWFIVWTSGDASGSKVVEVALDKPADTPKELPLAGYSPRVAPTPVAGLFLGVWVQGDDGKQDVYYQLFNK